MSNLSSRHYCRYGVGPPAGRLGPVLCSLLRPRSSPIGYPLHLPYALPVRAPHTRRPSLTPAALAHPRASLKRARTECPNLTLRSAPRGSPRKSAKSSLSPISTPDRPLNSSSSSVSERCLRACIPHRMSKSSAAVSRRQVLSYCLRARREALRAPTALAATSPATRPARAPYSKPPCPAAAPQAITPSPAMRYGTTKAGSAPRRSSRILVSSAPRKDLRARSAHPLSSPRDTPLTKVHKLAWLPPKGLS